MKKLIATTCLALIVAPNFSLAAASKDTSAANNSSTPTDSSGSGSQPLTGQVTVNASAGKAEATLLAASAVNQMSWQICQAVVAVEPTPNPILVVMGYTRPDVSDWLAFDANRKHVARQYVDLDTDYNSLAAAYAKMKGEVAASKAKVQQKAQAAGKTKGETEGLINGAILAFTPPKIALTAVSRLTTVIGQIAQSNYTTGGIDITLSDNVLANAVIGRLRTGARNISFADQHNLTKAADDTLSDLDGLKDTQRNFEATQLADVAVMLQQVKAWEAQVMDQEPDPKNPTRDDASLANLKTLEAGLTALQAHEATAAANVAALDQILFSAPAATQTTSTQKDKGGADDSDSSTPAADASQTTASQPAAATSQAAPASKQSTPLSTILKERTIASALTNGAVLYLKLESAGGGYYAKQNLWTFLGGMPFYVSAGATVTFELADPTGDILTSGSIPLGGDYLKATQVAAALGEDRGLEDSGDCIRRWQALPPVKKKAR